MSEERKTRAVRTQVWFVGCGLSFCDWTYQSTTSEADAQEKELEHFRTDHPGVPHVRHRGY